MNTKSSLGFGRFAQTTIIVLLLSTMIFVSNGSGVKGQIGTDEPPFSVNPADSQPIIVGDGEVPGGPGYIMISPYAFRPTYSYYQWDFAGGGLYNPSTTSSSGFTTGLSLPHKATITKLTLYYKDSHATEDLYSILYSGDGVGTLFPMTSLWTAGEAFSFRYTSTTSILTPTVDNQNYSYTLYVGFPPNVGESIILTNVRIDYEYSSYTPFITR